MAGGGLLGHQKDGPVHDVPSEGGGSSALSGTTGRAMLQGGALRSVGTSC